MKKSLATLLLFILASLPSFAVNRDRIQELNKQARAFAQQKDWKGLRDILTQIGQELGVPTPFQMLRMASAEARLENTEAALNWMSRYAATGLTYDAASDDDLKPLVGQKGYQAIASEMKDRSQPISKAEIVCSLSLADIMPEDLTYEKSSGTFIVSSVQHHSLYRVSLPKKGEQNCGVTELPLEADARRWPTFAVSLDATRQILWMSAGAVPGFSGFPDADHGKTALFALNASTGKIVKRFDLESGGPSLLGDMSIAPDGTVYVTDSIGGGVYRVRGPVETAKLEKIADKLFSPQTPVLAADGKRLFVADYSVGVAVIDLTSGKVDYLQHPENIAVTALDGLHRVGDSLLAVQNGTEPERIVRLHLNPGQTEITSVDVIEQGPVMGDPTHVIAVDGMAYVSTNVGWGKVDDNGNLKAGEHFSAPTLMRFPVK